MASKKSSVEVAIRVRPMRADHGETKCNWEIHSKSITEIPNPDNHFTFDRVYNTDSETETIYEKSVKESIVRHVANGYNGTVFAYGQTGSGKSFTMLGDNGSGNTLGVATMGILDLFAWLQPERDKGVDVKVSIIMIEIYNEALHDLMIPRDQPQANLMIRENEHGVYVHNAISREVKDSKACLSAMQAEMENRMVASTNMNNTSSRSHCLIRLVVEKVTTFEASDSDSDNDASSSPKGASSPSSAPSASAKKPGAPLKNRKTLQKKVVSSLNLVDLAGSERVSKTGATGIRMIEGGHINKSLTTLTTVIQKMTEARRPGQQVHIPFRDSKLTYLLKTAIGGNSFCTVFCCVHPAEQHTDETRSTLQFAQRAKTIKNEVQLNEVMDTKAKIRELELEIKKHRALMVATNLYLWSKDLKIRKLKEEDGSEAHIEQVTQMEQLIEKLSEENDQLQSDLREAQEKAAMGGGGGGAAVVVGPDGAPVAMHADPFAMGGFADDEATAKLRAEKDELVRTVDELCLEKEALQSSVNELEEIIDEMEKDNDQRNEEVEHSRGKIRQLEAAVQSVKAENVSLSGQMSKLMEQRRAEEKQQLEKAHQKGDELLEQLTKLQVERTGLEFEHNTLMDMFSRKEMDAAAQELEFKEELHELSARLESQKGETAQLNAHLWRFIGVAHLAAHGSPMAAEEATGPVKAHRIDEAVKALTLFVSSRLNRAPNQALHQSDDASPSARRYGRGGGGDNEDDDASGGPTRLQLMKRIKELENVRDTKRDVIIDTKLKRMQDLVVRLNGLNNRLMDDVRLVCQENNQLHDIIRRESRTAKAAASADLHPVSEELLKNRALYTVVPTPPWSHN